MRLLKKLLPLLLSTIPLASANPVALNLRNADIETLTARVAEITGKNFIIDPRVKGKVNVVLARPLDADEVYEVFLSTLAVHGFAAVPGKHVTKIVPLNDAKQSNIPTVPAAVPTATDQKITRTVTVRHIDATQLVPILRPLLPPQAHLAAAGSDSLILVGTAGNVARLADIIQRVDIASDQAVDVIALRHASAARLARVLTALEQNRPDVAARSRIVADERSNSILLSGDPATRLRLRTVLVHLDIPLEKTGDTAVIHLRYGNANELAPILQSLGETLQ